MTFETRLTESQLKTKVRADWDKWRLVTSDRGFTWSAVFGKPYMTPQDVAKANIALNMQYEAEKKAMKKK